ncbi:MAG: thioredoxin-dependent thiol peroxidase [Chitinophagales bacterium]|nr:thioredoxin-dependent thiol peroxidase [Chitinophagales bacterium]
MAVTSSITHLKISDKAPAIKAYDQEGKLFQLKDIKGKKTALYFYPNDDTETCVKEACNLRDNYQMLLKKGYEVIGVSHAPVASKKKFAEKYQLPFRLLSDPDLKICKEYGVFGDKLFMGKIIQTIHRITFIIDETGKIEKIIHRVKSGEAALQIIGIVS